MYLKFFGLAEKPFELTPDPKFLFLTPGHREALAQLTYGVQEQKGFILITGEVGTVPAAAMFVFIGAVPPTAWLSGALLLDDRGFLVTGPEVISQGPKGVWPLERDPFLLETSIPGVFAAGDVRRGSGKRVATAVGEGAMAVMSIWQYRAQAGL